MSDENPSVGWHPDPAGPYKFRYWNGQKWSGTYERVAPEDAAKYTVSGSGRFVGFGTHSLPDRGLRGLWYGKVVRWPWVFSSLAWLNRSVPLVRHRLEPLMQPPEARFPR